MLTSEAAAYRTNADDPELEARGPVTWTSASIELRVKPSGFGNEVDEATVDAVQNAAAQWNGVECTAFEISVALSDDQPGPYDGVNTVAWLDDEWGALGVGGDVPAVTDVQLEKLDGAWTIVGADVYLATQWQLTSEWERMLPVAMLHEVGHALGLLHPCEVNASDEAPECEELPGARGSVMYPVYSEARARLSEDDRNGVCWLASSDNGHSECVGRESPCEETANLPKSRGCTLVSTHGTGLARSAAGLSLLVAASVRRRKREPRRTGSSE